MEAVYANGAMQLVPSGIVGAEAVIAASADQPRRRRRPRPKPPDFLDIGNVGQHMRGGVKPPELLVRGWLQKGALHWLQGQPEHGKSWVLAWLVQQVIDRDRRAQVLWMDAEMGSVRVADRLLALGMDAATIERQLVHVNLTTVPREWFAEFMEFVVSSRFRLVVWDPMAQHLAGADLDENSNSGVAQWLAAMVNPVSAYGGTTIAVDHVSKPTIGTATAGFARGAGAKKARARVVYEITRRKGFDRRRRGEIEIRCMKNSDSAEIVRHRWVTLGGDPFVWRVQDGDSVDQEWSRKETAQDLRAVVSALDAAGQGGLSQSQLERRAKGNTNRIRALLRRLAAEPGFQDDYENVRRIETELREPARGGRKAQWFWLEK